MSAGLVSVVTPTLHGDIKTNQNTFLTLPVSVEDLHTSRSSRNFWVNVPGMSAWSVTGNSAPQIAQRARRSETARRISVAHRSSAPTRRLGLRAEVTNFVPANADQVELMRVTLTNIGDQTVDADAHRRHSDLWPLGRQPARSPARHVAAASHAHAALRRDRQTDVVLRRARPSAQLRSLTRCWALKTTARPRSNSSPSSKTSSAKAARSIGRQAIVSNMPGVGVDVAIDGYESIGGLRFAPIDLAPGQSKSFMLDPRHSAMRSTHARRIDRTLRHSREVRSGPG